MDMGFEKIYILLHFWKGHMHTRESQELVLPSYYVGSRNRTQMNRPSPTELSAGSHFGFAFEQYSKLIASL